NEVFIAVMGQTGAGKSSFINWVTGGNLVEGESLSSCTQEVQSASTVIDGRAVTLIDTPGFDDSTRFDGEILNLIASYLKHSFNRNELLSGVIYLHRITDNRIGGSGKRTMTVLQRMCGPDNFQNIALVTTMWDKLVDQKEGEKNEKELETTGEFWGQMISRKAMVSRHYGKKETAFKIVKQIIPKPTVSLTMQAELSLERANVVGTAAGKVIADYLQEQ
ncbi:P-loop containing nucleoside triphosphate hydrolase protein, partial [Phaeosphaeriaceae sp. PMI808]